jgi:hypothetical protein
MAIHAALIGRMKCCSIISMRCSTCGVSGGEILSNSTNALISRARAFRNRCSRLAPCLIFGWDDPLEDLAMLERPTTSEVFDAFID